MRYAISFILAFAILGSGSGSFAQIKKDVSEVTGVKRLESESMRSLYDKQYSGSHASFRAEYVNDPDDGTSWNITVYGFTEDTTGVTRSTDLLVNADGKQLEPLRLESKTRTIDGSLLEIKTATFSRSVFEQIATAQNATFSIGPAQFVAIHPRRKDMRLILDRVPSEQGPQTASSSDSSDSRR
jgi:hypothetical protein